MSENGSDACCFFTFTIGLVIVVQSETPVDVTAHSLAVSLLLAIAKLLVLYKHRRHFASDLSFLFLQLNSSDALEIFCSGTLSVVALRNCSESIL